MIKEVIFPVVLTAMSAFHALASPTGQLTPLDKSSPTGGASTVTISDRTGTHYSPLPVTNVTAPAVPEPQTNVLLLATLALMGTIALRRRADAS